MSVVSIPLTRGLFALVDKADLHLVADRKWYAIPKRANCDGFYAVSGARSNRVFMHRIILGLKDGQLGDHRDGDGLNNTRDNLRLATKNQNAINKHYPNKTGFRGVQRHNGKWRAQVHLAGKITRTRVFSTPAEAARAYDTLASQLHGEFARLNFPEGCPPSLSVNVGGA